MKTHTTLLAAIGCLFFCQLTARANWDLDTISSEDDTELILETDIDQDVDLTIVDMFQDGDKIQFIIQEFRDGDLIDIDTPDRSFTGNDNIDLVRIISGTNCRLEFTNMFTARPVRAYGGNEPDVIANVQIANGGGGNDRLYDSNQAVGGDGNDTIDGCRYVEGNAGDDIIQMPDGLRTQADGGPGSDWIVGGTGPDSLRGDSGDDFVFGLEGNDNLYGGAGFDIVYGGKGDDRLDAGYLDQAAATAGEVLYGQAGADQFKVINGFDHYFDDFKPWQNDTRYFISTWHAPWLSFSSNSVVTMPALRN